MKKVIIFTANSVDKLHPRIETERQLLESKGYLVQIFRTRKRREGLFWEAINLLTLKYFKWGAISTFKKQLNNCEIAHIYDLQLLPLAKTATKCGKKVVYETLDDNVFLHFSSLSNRLPFLRIFKKAITKRVARFERKYGSKYCNQVIVNSPNLLAKFNEGNVTYVPYTSPMEGLVCQSFSAQKETIFLYLGKLTVAKGAKIYEGLLRKTGLKLLFYGKAFDTFSKTFTSTGKDLISGGNLDIDDLKLALNVAFQQYNVIGLSIILPENESYKWQEANKDIDYLSMGIPFVGNERPPTFEKIDAGCGVLWQDDEALRLLIHNKNGFYDKISARCLEIGKKYSREQFDTLLFKVYQSMHR